MVTLKVKKIDDRAQIPHYAHDGDMCFDIHVLIDEDKNEPEFFSLLGKNGYSSYFKGDSVSLRPRETVMLHTGLVFETERGYGMKVHVRSSTGIKKHLILSNATAIIDTATYRGELHIALTNIGDWDVIIRDGDKIAQGEVVPILETNIVEVGEVSKTERGEGGIGSSGEK
jgi:dUTP pyrophosphatase